MIYALVVAIDQYPIPQHRLNGCVNDARSLVAYLEGNYDCEEISIKTIFDKEATKANVIAGFQHFQAAKAEDSCLFYYSGHGSQVISPTEFHHIDPDGKLETLVCWDSRIPAGGYDMMDKELSYLIWEATHQYNQHFVAIFDCCHSGTNTRDVRVTPRMAETARNIPTVDHFYGKERYQKGTVTAGRIDLVPPRGRHVALAAASASETAKELRIGETTRGAFTYNLISLLEQYNGKITYGQLTSNLKVLVANYVEKQSPQIDASEEGDKNRFFLGQLPNTKAPTYTVNFNKKADAWVVNAGAIHNWPADRAGEIRLSIDNIPLTVTKVDMMQSELADNAKLDKAKSYLAQLEKLPARQIKIALANDNEAEGNEVLLQAIKDRATPIYFEFTEDTAHADYWARAIDNTLRLTFPGEDRPVFRRLHGYNSNNALIFLDDTESVAHWHHVKSISNPRTTLKRDDYQIELLRIDQPGAWQENDDCPATTVNWQEEVVFNYDYDASKEGNEKWLQPAFRMKVKNTSNRQLYFSTVNLQADYAVKNKFMAMEVLQPGEELWLLDRMKNGDTYKCIPLSVDEAFLAHGVNELTEYMKVFVSTMELSTDDFNQDALEMDNPTRDTKRAGRNPANQPPKHDWTVEDIVMKTVRPTREVQVGSGEKREVANAITIEMPTGVSGLATLNCQPEAARNLSGSTPLPDFPAGWSNHDLAEGLSQKPPVNVLEFYNPEGADKVNADNPIKVQLNLKPTEDEFVVPVCFDPETGLYYPVGMMDEDGMVLIEDLPAPTPSGTRSLGGSIKIFFQKTVGKYLPFVYQHPQLAIGTFVEAKPEERAAVGIKLDYNTDADAVKTAVAGADRIVMYIHGIIGDTLEMPKSIRLVKDAAGHTLEDEYDLILTFDYENLNTPIEDTAQALKDRLVAAGLGPDHGKTFHIVAHSMGGLVSRWFIEKLDGNQVVNHLYQLGTPNQGSPYGSLYEMATPLLANAVNGAAFVQPYVIPLRVVGKFLDKLFFTLKQMNSDSDFLKALNDGSDPGIPYTIIAGNTQLIPPAVAGPQARLLQKVMARFKSRGHYDALDLLLFKSPNDIAVSTEKISDIPGGAERQFPPVVLECACDHISYFGNPAGIESMAKLMLKVD